MPPKIIRSNNSDDPADQSKRAIAKARQQAWHIANLAKSRYQLHPDKRNWPALSASLGITIPPVFTSLPCTFDNVKSFAQWWVDSVESRIDTNISPSERPNIVVENGTKFGNITLFPEQEGVYRAIVEAFWTKQTTRVVLNDGTMGSGKTFLAGALIADAIQHKRYIPSGPLAIMGQMPYRILVVTRKNVVRQYKRVLINMGLDKLLGSTIIVTAYSQLSSQFGKIFIKETFDPYTEKTTEVFNEGVAPFLVIWDECHGLNNPGTKQTKFCMAMNRIKVPPFQVFMSATPFVTVNHSRTFVLASRLEYLGQKVTEETFPIFAGTLAKRPDKPNGAAANRLRDTLAKYIFSFPKVKWKHKAINQCLLVDFHSEQDRAIYDRAFEIFQEKKRKAGENTSYGRFEEFVALGQFRKAAEPLRAPALIEQTMTHFNTGDKAVLIGCAFRETVQRIVHGLLKRGLTRDDISIIWGGKRAWKSEILLSDTELDDLMKRAARGEQLEPEELVALKETIEYRTERIMTAETPEQQAARNQQLAELKLAGTQSADQRQREVDNFQDGTSRVCIFTLAAGGVGLSLDHDSPDTLPRVGYFTPVYSGPEAQQALGRAVRRATLSDTYQFLVYLKDTVEATHVAPAMDKKLKSIASFTKNFFNLMSLDNYEHTGSVNLRTAEQAALDAESEESQLSGEVVGETPEDDDNE